MSTLSSSDYFEYECSKGHASGAHSPLLCCPAYVKGKPCAGELKRVGRGSRKAAQEIKP